MEFKKMVTITQYAKQKKRHRCTEQTFDLCGRRRGQDVSREQHRNMYIIKGETHHQPRLDAWDKCSDLVHWEGPEGSGGEGGGRGESGWGTHVNPWLIHVNVWQKPLQYCKVISLQLIKINGKKNLDWDNWDNLVTENEVTAMAKDPSVNGSALCNQATGCSRKLCVFSSPHAFFFSW